jgi:hypothetical protein
MENLKALSEINNPDQRNLMFVRMDTGEPLSMEEHHAGIASVVLDPRVPEEVRSYFATVQNICLYAWFAYDLYAVVEFLCCTAIEMALRARFPVQGRDRRSLSALFKEAMRKKLIREKGFGQIREMRVAAAQRLRIERRIMKQSSSWPRNSGRRKATDDYASVLSKAIPWVRNTFAHPRRHTIVGSSWHSSHNCWNASL